MKTEAVLKRNHVLVRPERRCNYWAIRKCGNKMMKKVLRNNVDEKTPVNDWVHNNPYLDNDYISFALIRNPFDRAESVYKYFYLTKEDETVFSDRPCQDFEEFVKTVLVPSKDNFETDGHIRSQSWYIQPMGQKLVHMVCDLDHINDDLVLKRTLRLAPDFEFPLVNDSKGEVTWTSELRRLVRHRYRMDFKNFGYG